MKTAFYKSVLFYISIFSIAGYIAIDMFPFAIFSNELHNRLLNNTLQQTLEFLFVLFLLRFVGVSLFKKPKNIFVLLPCLLVAVHNFPYVSFFRGNMELVHASSLGISLFALYCLSIGLLEECIFRGIVFYLLLERFPKTKTGFLKGYFYSSVLFGLAHLFNLFSGANVLPTLLQVIYSILTGGMFGFLLIKTKNILCPTLIHGVYNFCGTLFSTAYFGTGVLFDLPSGFLFAIVSIAVGIFVLRSIFTYSETERKSLYETFGIVVE